jgi:L-alanine-DL-glutamate epimerase-like enolase superfamily enzyme
MNDLVIDRAEVFVVGPDTERYIWAEGMSEQFMTNTIVRLTTKGGAVGIAGAAMINPHNFDRSVGETLRFLLPDVIGRNALAREAIWDDLRDRGTPTIPQALSLIDIALWDMVAKTAGMPLYQLLGGARSKILSYASTPGLPSVEAYVDYVERCAAEGYKAVKFHCWCIPELDLPMCETLATRFAGRGIDFMLDVEQRYDFRAALKVGKRCGEMGFGWFEAPLPDFDADGYRRLTRDTGVPILPAGNSWLNLQQIEQALRLELWSSARVDATICGGITPLRKIMGLAEAHTMNVEIQCWGYTLTQAANLHVMLAYRNCTYFEQPPYEAFEYGSHNVIRTDAEGYVHAPPGNGLGVEVDWAAVEAAAILKYEVR